MKKIHTVTTSPLQVLALLLIGSMFGCHRSGVVGIAMPKKIVDLSPIISEDLPVRQYGHRACEFLGLKERLSFSPVAPQKEQYNFGLSTVELPSIVGAHLDVPGRLLKGRERADEVPLKKLFGRAQVIDLRWKDRYTPLQVTDLEVSESKIVPDEILILFVGYTEPQDEDWPNYSPLSAQAAKWLADKKIRALATDMPSIGSLSRYADLMDKNRPPEEIWAERIALLGEGIPVIEGLANVDQLLNEPNIVFVGFPLPLADRGGAPMRAAALLY